MSSVDRIIAQITARQPDFIVGTQADPYLKRWWIIPRNRWVNVYLHNIIRSDDDRALHDHPWPNISVVLKGSYIEIVPTPGATTKAKLREAGSVIFRRAIAAHRLVIPDNRPPCWTLFITGPRVREWGFWCPKGWVQWDNFVRPEAKGEVGKGCGD
jgi:hypothetical protein